MTTVYVITSGARCAGVRLSLKAAQAAAQSAEELVSLSREWRFRWELSDQSTWLLTQCHRLRPGKWRHTGRAVQVVDLSPSGTPSEVLWQLVADTLTELSRRGIPITARRDEGPAYVGPNVWDGIRPARPGPCVVLADDGRWVVEDRTPRCAECREPLPHPGFPYCSTRCRNAADRHDDEATGLDGGL